MDPLMRRATMSFSAADLEELTEKPRQPSATLITALPSQPPVRSSAVQRTRDPSIFETKVRPETQEEKRRRLLVEKWVERRNGDTHLRDPLYMEAVRKNQPDLLIAISPRPPDPALWLEKRSLHTSRRRQGFLPRESRTFTWGAEP